MTIQRLKQLISETHQHGLKLKAEIAKLMTRKPRGWQVQVFLKTKILHGLEHLNRRRWKELNEKERPKPQRQFTMYDTTDPLTRLPTLFPQAVAGYVGGKWPSYAGLLRRYPTAKHLSIAVNAGEDARCLDIETGDATPAEAPAWVRRQHARGVKRPVVYANTSTMPQVLAALATSGIKRDEYLVWTAHYTGVPHIEAGSDATQYESVERGLSNYDSSRCQPWFLYDAPHLNQTVTSWYARTMRRVPLALLAVLIALVFVVDGLKLGRTTVSLSLSSASASPAVQLEAARKTVVSAEATLKAAKETVTALEAEAPKEEPVQGTVVWSPDLSKGLVDFAYTSFVAGHVNVVPDPLGSGHRVIEMAIPDSDRPYSGATAPRADLESAKAWKPGMEAYFREPFMLPAGFPHIGTGFFQIAEVYGEPYGGSPPVGIDLAGDSAGNHVVLQRDQTHSYDIVWKSPAVTPGWHVVDLRVRFATDNTGLVELWYDGVRQGAWSYATLVSGINWDGTHGDFLNTDSYRKAAAYPGTVTLFHGAPTIGTSLAAVQSHPIP